MCKNDESSSSSPQTYFYPPFLYTQGRNPTWGRPVRRSRPLRNRLPSCSSRPSGRWRTSSMSLHWSSSSLSGRTLSEKRTESCICWHKTSSTRKSTQKTEEIEQKRLEKTLEKKTESDRLLVTQWLLHKCECEHDVELQNNPEGWCSDQAVILLLNQTWMRRSNFISSLSSQQHPGASAPPHFHQKGRPCRATPPARVGRQIF